MSKSRAELIDQAIINLGVLQPDQTTTPENIAKMDTVVDPAIAELAELEIYYVSDAGDVGPSGGEIEDSAFLSLANYIANAACAAFNLPADAKMQVLATQAEAKLRTLSAPTRARKTLQVDAALLNGRGRRFNFTSGR